MEKFSDAIISIRPNFAEAILAGVKSIELRRRIPPIEIGIRLWIYATRPVGAVIGSATVQNIIRGTPDEVWLKAGNRASIDRISYDAYFEGTDAAIGLALSGIKRGHPISIDVLRSIRSGFHPPQVIARITKDEANSIQMLSFVSAI